MKNKKLEKDIQRIVYILGGLSNIKTIYKQKEYDFKYIVLHDDSKVKKEYYDLFGIREDHSTVPKGGYINYLLERFKHFQELCDFVLNEKVSEEHLKQLENKIDKEMEIENE